MLIRSFIYPLLSFSMLASAHAETPSETRHSRGGLADSLAQSMDIPAEFLVSAFVTGDSNGFAVLPSFGVIEPALGDSMAAIGTGPIGSADPRQDFDNFQPATLTVSLFAPEGVNRLSFQYNFFTSEFPNLFPPGFDVSDTLTITVTDTSGTREVARETIQSPLLRAANGSNAGGTGFEIPSQEGGPSGSTTGFQTIEVDVADNSAVLVKFEMEDRNDFFANSVVLVDSMTLGSIQVRDPNLPGDGDNLVENGRIVNDPERLMDGGREVKRAAADGVTQLLVRSRVSGPGSVEFCLDDGATAPADGGFGPVGIVGEPVRADCAEVDVEEIEDEFYAFSVYTVPDDFDDGQGAHVNAKERDIMFKSTFTAESGTTSETTDEFTIARPPVFLIHGLWSNKATWQFALASDDRFEIVLVDYSGTNDQAFAVNQGVLGRYLRLYKRPLKSLNQLAFTQVDVLGHSMGGLLTRLYTQTPNYERSENFNQGDVNRLITLDTPHLGSPFGNKIMNIRDSNPLTGFYLETILAKVTGGIPVGGATDNLAIGSAAMNSIQRTEVPSHALLGLTGQAVVDALDNSIDVAQTENNPPWAAVAFLDKLRIGPATLQGVLDGAFGGEDNDLIVGRASQEGGIVASARSIPTPENLLAGTHTFVTGSSGFSARAIELLNTPVESASFGEFPAVSSQPVTIPTSPNVSVNSVSDGIEFAFVRMDVAAGGTASISVDVIAPANVTAVNLSTPRYAFVDDSPPFEFALNIPDDAAGPLEVVAVGSNASGDVFFTTNTLTLNVTTPASLQSLSVDPPELLFSDAGESDQLGVTGQFDDMQSRILTTAGTTYVSADTSVATVSPEGLVEAVAIGRTFIEIDNAGVKEYVSVDVGPPNARPVAVAGPDQLVLTGTPVTLDAAASTDSDMAPGALQFEWNQVDGPSIGFFSPSSATLQFTPSSEAEFVFGLRAFDGQDVSAIDSVTVRAVVSNDVPVAVDDAYMADADTALVVRAPGVLLNDTDSHPLSAQLVSPPVNGTVDLTASGRVEYLPDAGFTGVDSFTYEVTDGLDVSNLATVTVTVSGSVADSDGDGVPDSADNCTLLANPGQVDTDGDGYGNRCDADFNNDCIVNVVDLGQFRMAYFGPYPLFDLNNDGQVNILDLGLFRLAFFTVPGPSGVTQVCGAP